MEEIAKRTKKPIEMSMMILMLKFAEICADT